MNKRILEKNIFLVYYSKIRRCVVYRYGTTPYVHYNVKGRNFPSVFTFVLYRTLEYQYGTVHFQNHCGLRLFIFIFCNISIPVRHVRYRYNMIQDRTIVRYGYGIQILKKKYGTFLYIRTYITVHYGTICKGVQAFFR